MNKKQGFDGGDIHNWICPNLTTYWQLGKVRHSEEFFLQAVQGNQRFQFSLAEGFALQHFTGHFTVKQVQTLCHKQLGEDISPNLVVELLQKLIDREILIFPEENNQEDDVNNTTQHPPSLSQGEPSKTPNSKSSKLRLKPCVHWIEHPDGYWILRNPEDVTYLQVDTTAKAAIEQLSYLSPVDVAQQQNLTLDQLRYLLQLLTATGMLEGTKPSKPAKRKFTPLQLLFFQFPLFNPDPWLTKHIDGLRWIWTRPFAFILCFFLAFSTAISLSEHQAIWLTGKQLMSSLQTSLLLPFILLTILVVTLHELGHAFTLKHYGGIVPEVGVMIRFFFPAAYTNTTDSYCLVKRRQRGLVVGAGVLCQVIIWAMGLWLWNLSSSGTWLSTTSYLLMVAALFTVAINLNPLTKFDGYYLAVALSGINNLRSRSFGFYANLLSWRPIQENRRDALVLAAYAPFSLAYTLLVFGHLFGWLGDWSLTNIPFWTLTLLTLWAIYFYWPNSTNPASITMTSTNSDSYPLKPRTTPPLQVVQPRTKPTTPTTPVDSTASQPATPAKSYRGWVILAVVAISLGMMSFIPTSFEVGGPVELETREGARAVVRTPMAGVVAEIHVKAGDEVQRGQILAQLSSWDLDREITATEQQLAQVRQNLQESRQDFIRAQAQLVEVKAVAETTQKKANREGDRAAILTQGQLTPELQVLETQRQRLQERIPEVEDRERRYQELYTQGVISQDRRDEVKFERRDLQSALAAKTQEIEATKQRLKDTASDLHSETISQQASIDATRMIADAEGQIAAGRDAIATLEHRLAQLKTMRESLTLRAPMTGVVLTSDLDLRRNQELKPGEEFLLEIADLNDLTATVEVKEEDLEYVHLNKPVTFRPRQAKLRPYNATVKMILPKIESDPNKPHRVARVQIVVNNSDGKLLPGASGYAKIWSEQIPLYERLNREVQRIIPLERFLWGEQNNSSS